MNTIRAFIAVEIDESARQKVSSLITRLKTSDADVKWITENQMHLTLKFLGNIEQDMVQKIAILIKSIAKDFNKFTIRFSGIGTFPNMHRPRVIWLGIDKGSDFIKRLNDIIESELGNLGFEKEKRGYKAHLTLGRVKSLKNIHNLIQLIEEDNFEGQDEIKIDKLVLLQSTLTGKGAIYTPLAEIALSPPYNNL